MYEYLDGVLESAEPPQVVLEVGGIGFLLNVSLRAAKDLPPKGSHLRLYVHMHAAEGEVTRLYGFSTPLERNVFRHLISVSRVGPAAALALLSAYDPEEVVLAIVHGESDQLVRAKGVGRKTAERMVLELRESFQKLSTEVGMKSRRQDTALALDLLHVLIGLGFSSREAQRRVEELIEKHPGDDLETLLRYAMS